MSDHLFLKLLVFIITLSMSASDAIAAKKLKFDSNLAIYTSNSDGYRSDQTESVLSEVIPGNQKLILFIHGRGNEPKKSLRGATFIRGKAVHKLERQYASKVLLFNWESKGWGRDRDRPLSKVDQAADSLKIVLDGMYKSTMSGERDAPISLLAHSMGSIVVQRLIERHGWPWTKPIFSSVLFSAPDANESQHIVWLDSISRVENVFVTINSDDKALKRSNDARPGHDRPLGLKRPTDLSTNTSYVDFSGLGKSPGKKIKTHEIFNKKAMLDQTEICTFFNLLLSGEEGNAPAISSAYPIGHITPIQFSRKKSHPCFSY